MKKLIFFASILSLTFGAAPCAFGQLGQVGWNQTALNNEDVMCFAVSGTTLFAGIYYTDGGGIYRSTDNGANWSFEIFGLPPNISIVSLLVSGTNLYAVAHDGNGSGGGVYLSIDSGISWKSINHGINSDSTTIDCIAVIGSKLFAGTNGYGIYLSTNNGKSWNASSSGITGDGNTVYSLAVSGSNIIAGTYDGIFLSSDNGVNWIPDVGSPTEVYSFAVNGSNVVAGSNSGNGAVWLSSNSGISWTSTNNGLSGNGVLSVAIVGNYLVAGTSNKGVFLSTANGGTWNTDNTGFPISSSYVQMPALAVVGTNLFVGMNSGSYGVWFRPLSDYGIAAPTIAISKDTLNFGTLKSGSDSTLAVVLYNRSSTYPVGLDTNSITGMNAGRFAITGNSKQLTLPYELLPGDSIGITIKYTAPSSTETDQASLRVPFAETPDSVIQVTLIGSSESLAAVAIGPSNQFNISASPNPTDAGAVISFTTPSAGTVKIEVFDVLGNNITASGFEGMLATGSHAVPVSLAGLPSGIYYARVSTGVGTQTVKLVKD